MLKLDGLAMQTKLIKLFEFLNCVRTLSCGKTISWCFSKFSFRRQRANVFFQCLNFFNKSKRRRNQSESTNQINKLGEEGPPSW